MKKIESSKLEVLNGSKAKCGTGGELFTGALCAAAVLTGPWGLLLYGPSCGAMYVSCFT